MSRTIPRRRAERGPASSPPAAARRRLREVLAGVRRAASRDNLSVVSAGVAFWAFLAIPPSLAALIATVGLLADPSAVRAQFEALGDLLPPEATTLILDQIDRLTAARAPAVTLSALVGSVVAVWSATKGTRALMLALNIVYGVPERRRLLQHYAVAIALTLGGVLSTALVMAMLVALPGVLHWLGVPEELHRILGALRWPVLFAIAVCTLAVLYRLAPHRPGEPLRLASWGALVGTALWLSVSLLFALYLARIADLEASFGSLGAVVALQLWFFVSTYSVLLGAELNAELESGGAGKGAD